MTMQNTHNVLLCCSVAITLVWSNWAFSAQSVKTPAEIESALKALKLGASETTAEALLEIALAPGVRKDQAIHAASLYRSKITNQVEAARLLTAGNDEIREIGLSAMVGCQLDSHLWEELKVVLGSGTVRQKGLVAAIAHHDDRFSAQQKAATLISSFDELEAGRGAGTKIWYLWQTQSTACEIAYEQLTKCLMQMKGLEIADLISLTPSESGVFRDCLIVARAYRVNESAREELRHLALENEFMLIRNLAIAALARGRAAQDRETLERIAKEDPAVVKNYTPHLARSDADLNPRTFYPLREQASEAIQRITRSSDRGPR